MVAKGEVEKNFCARNVKVKLQHTLTVLMQAEVGWPQGGWKEAAAEGRGGRDRARPAGPPSLRRGRRGG